MSRPTYTFVTMGVPTDLYSLIKKKLEDAGYHQAIYESNDGEVLDMRGIALEAEDPELGGEKPVKITPGSAYSQAYAVAPDVKWLYSQPPLGTQIFLLTEGGKAVEGIWRKDGGFIAWHPMFKRDKALEEFLGLS